METWIAVPNDSMLWCALWVQKQKQRACSPARRRVPGVAVGREGDEEREPHQSFFHPVHMVVSARLSLPGLLQMLQSGVVPAKMADRMACKQYGSDLRSQYMPAPVNRASLTMLVTRSTIPDPSGHPAAWKRGYGSRE
jgi:hypothetical protein